MGGKRPALDQLALERCEEALAHRIDAPISQECHSWGSVGGQSGSMVGHDAVFETTTIVREHVRELPDGTTLKEIWKETRPPDIRGALWWLERRADGFGRRPERSGKLKERFETVIVDPAESESGDDTKPTGRLGSNIARRTHAVSSGVTTTGSSTPRMGSMLAKPMTSSPPLLRQRMPSRTAASLPGDRSLLISNRQSLSRSN